MSAQEAQIIDTAELVPICDYELAGDNRTVSNKQAFINWYREKASIFHAARAAGVARSTVYKWMDEDEQFAQAVADSFEDAADVAETSAYERAIGRDCKPDSLLLMFWLKAHRPKYRDRVSVDVEVVRNEIQERMSQLNLRQLPVGLTQFLPVDLQTQAINNQTVNNLQIPPQPALLQKEDTPDSE